MKKIVIYTDGACSGNPGPGGWGAVLLFKTDDKIIAEKKIKGSDKQTTNNKMELTAVIEALVCLKDKTMPVEIFTDSNYVKDGIEKWIFNWKKNGWRTANKSEVKNKELWIALDEQVSQFNIKWNWVKGHSGDKYNEIADALARNDQ